MIFWGGGGGSSKDHFESRGGRQGFQFTFQRGGGIVPPLRGGTQGGGFGQVGGGMPRETSRQ